MERSDWNPSAPIHTSLVPARTAFERALALLRSKHPNSRLSVDDRQGLQDVLTTIERARVKYEGKSSSRARRWLAQLAISISKFVPMFDAIVPQSSEYAAAAWGTLRILLVLFQNQEELIGKLSEFLTEIAYVLPQVDIDTSLYELSEIQHVADGINCSIVKLFDEMMSFYEESRAKHVMHALTRPFAVRFQAIVDSVRMKSMLLVRLASAYGRKEGRAVRAEVQSLAKQHQISERRMMDQMLRGLAEIKQLVSMQHNVVSDQSLLTHQHLRDLQAAAMIQMSSSDIFEDPSNVLTRQLSICKRLMQRKRKGLDLTGVWDHPSLITFGSCQKSQMMIVQGSPRVQQKAMAVGSLIADFIRAAALPMLSVLQPAGLGARICTTSSQVIKFLAVQALKARGDLSETVSDDFNAAKIAGATGSEQWERILAKAIQGLPVVYAVIDLGVLQDRHEVAALYRSLQAVTTVSPTTVFKVALISLSTHGWESASRAIFVTLDSGPISGIPAMRRKPPSRQRGARAGAGFRSSLANNKL